MDPRAPRRRGRVFRKFQVTTLAALNKREPGKQHNNPDPKNKMFPLRVRASCDEAVQEKACACLYTCPPVVTKDERKTVRTVETGYFFSDETVTTHTRTATCTPSVSNPSFYLSATMASYPSNLPTPLPYYQKYMRLAPDFDWFREVGALFWPRYVAPKADAGIFSLDGQGRLMSETSYGVHYLTVDPYNDFQLMEFLTESWADPRGWFYIYCKMNPPSRLFAGGYKELSCNGSFWQVDTFQYCPLYDEYFDTGSVIGSKMSDTTPDCFPMTFLVVPLCS
ncbi:hypothetical protein CTA2_5421 [Colletotrichum tanaceti]|nr:hypothetical protein CTA2_5421 [Colletotrichum tanaceti]